MKVAASADGGILAVVVIFLLIFLGTESGGNSEGGGVRRFVQTVQHRVKFRHYPFGNKQIAVRQLVVFWAVVVNIHKGGVLGKVILLVVVYDYQIPPADILFVKGYINKVFGLADFI